MNKDNDTDQEIRDDDAAEAGQSTFSSDIEEDNLHNHQEVFCLGLEYRDKSYELQRFHYERTGPMPILSLHALHLQIPEIYLRQWYNHCSTAKSHPPSTNCPCLNMNHLPGHWSFPTSPVETRLLSNLRPVVIRTFPNTKRLLHGSEKVHEGNRILEACLANNIWWQVLNNWRSFETSDWGSGSSAGISRCTSRYSMFCQMPSGPSLRIDPHTREAVSPQFCLILLYQTYGYWLPPKIFIVNTED